MRLDSEDATQDNEEDEEQKMKKLKKEREEQIYNSIFQSKGVGTSDDVFFRDDSTNTNFVRDFTKEAAV